MDDRIAKTAASGNQETAHLAPLAPCVHSAMKSFKIDARPDPSPEEKAHLDTFDFQARGFYEKNGFHVFGTIENYRSGTRGIT